MSTTSLLKPVLQESIPYVPEPEPQATLTAKMQTKAETNPLVIVFVVCVVAFHLAAAMIGSVAAWIYYLRNSGAFTQ